LERRFSIVFGVFVFDNFVHGPDQMRGAVPCCAVRPAAVLFFSY
jgi:hypothetical protein